MFEIYKAVARLRQFHAMPAHLEFVAVARSGALGYMAQQLCSAQPFGALPRQVIDLFQRNHEEN
jgi:hypothetical protein